MADILEIKNVSKTYNADSDNPVVALDGVDLDIAEGEFVSIIGPSGCGKSTLFNVIGGLIDDHDGEVLIEGRPVDGAHKDVGVVFQEESTFPWRSTLDNVAFPLEIEGVDKEEREKLARKFIKLVGLDGFENHFPAQLSGGMKQRTAVARTLAYEPRIMLLGDKMLEIWAALNQTMLLITHNITEAVQLSDRVVVMSYRPGTIKEIIPIELPRPRSSEVISTPEFGTYVGKLWTLLREEASRGMVDEEAAIAAT